MTPAHDFFQFARLRYRIYLRRQAGTPPPWTEDPILAQWRFCNVFREDDRTTIWFRENVRDVIRGRHEVLLATIAFRWFNRISTGEKILDLLRDGWDTEEARRRLTFVKPLVTGAYIIKTPDGMSKLDGILQCIDYIATHNIKALQNLIKKYGTLKAAHALLIEWPYLGPFMAYEIVTDLRHTFYLESATDIMSWACPGPGCVRGLGWVIGDDLNTFSYSTKKDAEHMLELMRELLLCSSFEANWPKQWPRWEMREVEHTLCEYDKYRRAQTGQSLKRRYACSTSI